MIGPGRLPYLRYLLLVYGLGRGTVRRCWSDPAVIDLTELDGEGLGCYPLDFSRDAHPAALADGRGVPMIDYASLGRQYNAWFVGHVALGYFTRWRRAGRPEDLARFRAMADWFVARAVPCDAGVKWLYEFDWFGCKAPWFSGLSQAHAISVLLRAAQAFEAEKYAQTARRGMELMLCSVSEGGTCYRHPDGTLSFEECPRPSPCSILNGHVFSLFAAREAARFFGDPRYQTAVERGIDFVQRGLPRYDLGYWSCYSLAGRPMGVPDIASRHYHGVHVAQLRVLDHLWKNRGFGEAAARFDRYLRSPAKARKALRVKLAGRILSIFQ